MNIGVLPGNIDALLVNYAALLVDFEWKLIYIGSLVTDFAT